MKKIILAVSLFLLCGHVFANNITSQYSALSGKQCRKLDEYSLRCKGIANYKLDVLDDDNRMSIDVITPTNKKTSLNLWHVVTGSFSHLGTVADWRVTKQNGHLTPIALIVRVHIDIPDGITQKTSKLAIAKITPKTICVTHVINGNLPNANAKARELADNAANKPCLTGYAP